MLPFTTFSKDELQSMGMVKKPLRAVNCGDVTNFLSCHDSFTHSRTTRMSSFHKASEAHILKTW